jgi:hypothetical protein
MIAMMVLRSKTEVRCDFGGGAQANGRNFGLGKRQDCDCVHTPTFNFRPDDGINDINS